MYTYERNRNKKKSASSYSASDRNTRKAEDVMTRQELSDKLAEIDDRYVAKEDGAPPSIVDFEHIEYDSPTDEEIAERAEAELAGYRAEGRADIESDAEARRRSAYEKKADAGRTLKSEERAIADDYESALGSYGSEMARRGLARSSVAAEGAAAIEKGRADALSSARSARAAADAEADSELRALEADMQKALNAFDIAYAARLTERIAELTSEREEREAEAIKYENRLKEKEYDIMREVTDGDYETVKKGEVPSSLLDIYNEERYEAVNKYLSGLDPEEAESVVRNDPFIRDSVSDYWYYMLYRTYSLDE